MSTASKCSQSKVPWCIPDDFLADQHNQDVAKISFLKVIRFTDSGFQSNINKTITNEARSTVLLKNALDKIYVQLSKL